MSNGMALSDDAKAAGHRLFQELYAQVAEGVPLAVEQVLEAIGRLISTDVSASELIRAAMAQADFRYRQASDDEAMQTAEDATPESSGRMFANADVGTLLQEAQMQLWSEEEASWSTFA